VSARDDLVCVLTASVVYSRSIGSKSRIQRCSIVSFCDSAKLCKQQAVYTTLLASAGANGKLRRMGQRPFSFERQFSLTTQIWPSLKLYSRHSAAFVDGGRTHLPEKGVMTHEVWANPLSTTTQTRQDKPPQDQPPCIPSVAQNVSLT
jgi:hypothetical protein